MSPNADKKTGKSERCPICAKEAAADYAPFCSKRCADVDRDDVTFGQEPTA